MTTLFTDAFTGSNGAALNSSNWTVARTTTGASATIQGNKGRWDTGTVADYNGAVSVRYAGSTQGDIEWAGTFTFVGTQDGRVEVWARCDDASNPGNGYFLALYRTGTINLFKAVGFSYNSIASASFSFTTGTAYKFRFRAVGTSIQGRVWLATDTEPGTWTMSVTDSSINTAGQSVLHVQGGGSAGLQVDFDDVTLTDGATGLTRVSGGYTLAYDVRQRVSGSVDVRYDVRQRVEGTKAFAWDVQSTSLSRVSGSKDISWDVRQRVEGSKAFAWDVQVTGEVTSGAFVKHNGALAQIPL